MNAFKDFAEPTDNVLVGSKMNLKDIVGKEIVVSAYMVKPSKYQKGDCVYIQFKLDGDDHVVFTSSTVLKDQLERYKDKLPFTATIKREGANNRSYYTFT